MRSDTLLHVGPYNVASDIRCIGKLDTFFPTFVPVCDRLGFGLGFGLGLQLVSLLRLGFLMC